jgi:hypothetical protein
MRFPVTVASLACLTALVWAGPVAPVIEEGTPAPAPTVEALGEALVAANASVEALTTERNALRLQMEALGVAALDGGDRSVQERLIKAVSDLRLAEKAKAEAVEQSSRLAEAGAAYLANPSNDEARELFAVSLRDYSASGTLAIAEPITPDGNGSKIVSFKPELQLAVSNSGKAQGIRLGSPMRVTRGDADVATGVVVDLRDRLSGVLITSVQPDQTVRVGDSLAPLVSSITSEKK